MSRYFRFSSLLIFLLGVVWASGGGLAAQAGVADSASAAAARHQSSDWLILAPHLVDLQTGSVKDLELDADVLRARRFEEDALEFYEAALARGGDKAELYNRLGVTELALRHPVAAQVWFKRLVALQPKEADAWNNLGAAEFFLANYRAALHDYLRAVKLQKTNAVFHANLATNYFELKDYESAQGQFGAAFRLDHGIFSPTDSSGVEARVLTETDRGRFCFALAAVAAKQKDEGAMLGWLTQASEDGYDIREGMAGDAAFQAYANDARVKVIVANAKMLRSGKSVASAPVPMLPAAEGSRQFD